MNFHSERKWTKKKVHNREIKQGLKWERGWERDCVYEKRTNRKWKDVLAQKRKVNKMHVLENCFRYLPYVRVYLSVLSKRKCQNIWFTSFFGIYTRLERGRMLGWAVWLCWMCIFINFVAHNQIKEWMACRGKWVFSEERVILFRRK